MAVNGKRNIFNDVKDLTSYNAVATAAIRPGSLVVQSTVSNNDAVTESALADNVTNQRSMLADYNFLQAQTVDDSWAANSVCVFREVPKDCRANALIAANQNITQRGTPLSSNADGTLKIAAADGSDVILFFSDEIINVGATPALAHVRGA